VATLTSTNLTLLDVANKMDPKGRVPLVVEMLSEQNEILQYLTAIEGNDGTGHKTIVRTGLPAGAWRKLNYGVPSEKSTTMQVRDSCGMLETYSKADKAIIDMASDPAGARMDEDRAFLEGLSQTFADTLFYGDTDTTPEKFLGLGPRFDDLSGPANADNIISGGGSGSDNTSVWLIGCGPLATHLIYPKGSKAGVQHRDLGEDTASDGAGGEFQIYRTHYKWDVGLTTRDWRKIVRICNIDVSELTKDASGSSADLIDLMTRALELVKAGSERWIFACNSTVKSFLRRQIRNKANVNLTFDTVAGKRVLAFDDVPVVRCDAISNAEATIS